MDQLAPALRAQASMLLLQPQANNGDDDDVELGRMSKRASKRSAQESADGDRLVRFERFILRFILSLFVLQFVETNVLFRSQRQWTKW